MAKLPSGYTFVVLFAVWSLVTENATAYHKSKESKNDILRGNKFAKLLKSIANLNEDRLRALEKYSQLQAYDVNSGFVRQADEKKEHVVAIVLLNDNNLESADYTLNKIFKRNPNVDKLSKINPFQSILKFIKDNDDTEVRDGEEIELENTNIDNESDNELSNHEEARVKLSEGDMEMGKHDILRKWKSCTKTAKKVCRKACKRAYKDVCDSYKCSKSMKRALKKACRRHCDEEF